MSKTENILYDMEGVGLAVGDQIVTSDSSSSHLGRCVITKITKKLVWFRYLIRQSDGTYRSGGRSFNRDPDRVLKIPSAEFTPYQE